MEGEYSTATGASRQQPTAIAFQSKTKKINSHERDSLPGLSSIGDPGTENYCTFIQVITLWHHQEFRGSIFLSLSDCALMCKEYHWSH